MAQLTEEEWHRLLPFLNNIKPERQQAAYNRLVKGMTFSKAGEAYGYHRQDVNVIVRRILAKYEKLKGSPAPEPPPRGYVRVELVVPQRRVDEVRRVVAAMCAAPDPEPEEKRPVRSRDRPST